MRLMGNDTEQFTQNLHHILYTAYIFLSRFSLRNDDDTLRNKATKQPEGIWGPEAPTKTHTTERLPYGPLLCEKRSIVCVTTF